MAWYSTERGYCGTLCVMGIHWSFDGLVCLLSASVVARAIDLVKIYLYLFLVLYCYFYLYKYNQNYINVHGSFYFSYLVYNVNCIFFLSSFIEFLFHLCYFTGPWCNGEVPAISIYLCEALIWRKPDARQGLLRGRG